MLWPVFLFRLDNFNEDHTTGDLLRLPYAKNNFIPDSRKKIIFEHFIFVYR